MQILIRWMGWKFTSRSDNHKDYFDDSAMAEYGRKSYKYKAIAKSKEKIRDSAVRIQAYRLSCGASEASPARTTGWAPS